MALSPGFINVDIEHGGSESGLGDTGLFSAYRFMDESQDGVDVAASASLRLPTGDEDKSLGEGNVEPGLGLTVAKTLGAVVAVGEAYYIAILDGHSGEKDGILGAGREGVFAVTEQATLKGVVYGEIPRWRGTDNGLYAGAGGVFLPEANVRVSGSLTRSLTDDASDWKVRVSAGYEFQVPGVGAPRLRALGFFGHRRNDAPRPKRG